MAGLTRGSSPRARTWESSCLSNHSTEADSLPETAGLKALPFPSCQEGTLDLCLSSSFLLLLYPNHWESGKQELGRTVLMTETHTVLGLSCPSLNSECENRDGRLYLKCGNTHREAWPILPILEEAQLCTQASNILPQNGMWPF